MARAAEADDAPPELTLHVAPAEPELLYSKTTAVGAVTADVGRASTYAYFAWFRNATRTTHADLHARGFRREHVRRRRRQARPLLGGAHAVVRHDRSARARRLANAALEPRRRRDRQVFGTVSEYKDSLHYQFEFGDIIANVSGALFTLLLENVPARRSPARFPRRVLADARVPPPALARQCRRRAGLQRAVVHARAAPARHPALHRVAVVAMGPVRRRGRGIRDPQLRADARRSERDPAPDVVRRDRGEHAGGPRRAVLRLTGRRIGDGVFEFVSAPFTTLRTSRFRGRRRAKTGPGRGFAQP